MLTWNISTLDTWCIKSLIETKEELDKAVSGLSHDQLRVYTRFTENVDHFYKHKNHGKNAPSECCCRNYKPLRMICSGFGGSGKSHLIRVMMGYQYVRSEVEKKQTNP